MCSTQTAPEPLVRTTKPVNSEFILKGKEIAASQGTQKAQEIVQTEVFAIYFVTTPLLRSPSEDFKYPNSLLSCAQ